MNVVTITAHDEAGQQFNGYYVHRDLLSRGHSSTMFVAEKKLDDSGIVQLGGQLARRINARIARIEDRVSLRCVIPSLGLSVFSEPAFRAADLVHLQLIHSAQFLSLLQVPFLARRRPLVWTMHDPWLTSGHCVHSLGCERWRTGCGRCPSLDIPLAMRRDATALNYRIKRAVLQRARPHLVVASDWMRQRVQESPILDGLPVTKIPFGIAAEQFGGRDRDACRARLGIPSDARVAALRWAPYNILKGTAYAEKALEMLPPGVISHLITFDSDALVPQNTPLTQRYRFVPLGWVGDRDTIADALTAADVFLMPSLAETFGMMAVEAMACGTPVIAFDGTSLPEVLDAPRGGLVTPQRDPQAFAHAITRLMVDPNLYRSISQHGRHLATTRYTLSSYTSAHIALYTRLLEEHGRS